MNYKNYFWSNLQYVKELSFFSENQLPAIEEQKKKNAEAEIDADPEYEYIENILEQKYEQVYNTYGEKLRILANKQLQEAQLYIGIPSTSKFSPQQLNLLTTILHARKNGVTQANLTTLWDLDPRSTGHYVKVLEQKGAIQRAMVCINTIRTNLCVHARFKNEESIVTNDDDEIKPSNLSKTGVILTPKVFEETVVNLLTNAMDNIMPANDLLSAMGLDLSRRRVKSWFNRNIDKLCDKDIVKKVAAKTNDTRLRVRCFQLVKHDEDDSTRPIKFEELDKNRYDNSISFEDLTPFVLNPRKSAENNKLLCYVTLDRQIMQVIYNSGEKGIIQKEIGISLGSDNRRTIASKLDKLVTILDDAKFHYGINRALEFERKKRLYRYYSYVNYAKVVEQKTIDIPDYKPFVFSETNFALIDFRTVKPITGKRKKTPKRLGKTKGVENENTDKEKSSTSSKNKTTATKPNKNSKKGNNKNKDSTITENTSPPPTTAESSSAIAESSSTTTEPLVSNSVPSSTPTSIPSDSTSKKSIPLASIFTRKRSTIMKASISESSKTDSDGSQSLPSDEPPAKRQMIKNKKPSKGNKNDMDVTMEASLVDDDISQINTNTDNTSDQSTKRPRDESISVPTPPTTRAKRSCKTASNISIANYFKKTKMNTSNSIDNLINNNNNINNEMSNENSENIPNKESSSASTTNENSITSIDKSQQDSTIVPNQQVENNNSNNNNNDDDDDDDNKQESEPSTNTEISTNKKVSLSCKVPVVSLPPVTIQKSASKNKKSKVRSTPNPPPQYNTYLERRKNIILAVLEENNIIERGLELKKLYEKKMSEMYGSDADIGSPSIDSKTLWRTVEVLEKEKKLSTYTGKTTLLNGSQVSKAIVIHHSIEPHGQQIKDYFKYLNEKKLLQPHIVRMKTLERTDLVVERLHDRIKRLEQSKDDALAKNNHTEAKRIENDMSLLLANADKSSLIPGADYKSVTFSQQISTATQFGFVNSRLIRAKLFHQYLFGLIAKDDGGFEDQTSIIIPSSKIIQELTLGISCKIVGVFYPNDEFKTFMKNEENYNTKIIDLSDNIRAVVFQYANKFRWRLRILFDLLEFLGVLEPVNDTSEFPSSFDYKAKEYTTKTSSSIALAYKIKNKTKMYNYRLPDHPLVKEMPIDNPSNIMVYWSDLQYLSTTYSANEGESELPFIKDESEGAHIRALHTLKNWSTDYVYSYEQRRTLNKYIDVVNRKTPMNNIALCKTIAEELDSTTDIIRTYYRRAQMTMERQYRRRKLKEQQKVPNLIVRTRKQNQTYTDAANRAISLSTTNPFKVNRKLTAAEELAKQQNKRKSSSSKTYMDDDDEFAPQIEVSEVQTKLVAKRNPRKVWSSEDEELLKIIYVILKHRSEFGHRFHWNNAKIILPEYNVAQMRRRIQSLKEKPDEKEQIQNIQIKWRYYYNYGVKNDKIKAWKYVSDDDFDISSILTYYLIQEQNSNDIGQPSLFFPVLPYSAEYIKSHHNIQIVQNNNISRANIYFEDDFHQSTSSNGMLLNLVSNTFTMRTFEYGTYDVPVVPSENTYDNRITELIITFFKMIIFTPIELYDPYYSYAVLNNFPNFLFKSAIQYLRDDGLLVRVKGNRVRDRRIPGTQFGISDKYMRIMSNKLPKKFFDKACEYEDYINKEKNLNIVPIELNGGMMGCILDMFSDGKISLNFQTNADFNNENLIPDYDARRLREIQIEYGIGIELINDPRTIIKSKNNEIDNIQQLIPLTPDQLQIQLDGLNHLRNNDETYKLIKEIVDYLTEVGQKGATLHELYQHLNSKNESSVTVNNKQLLDCINIMAYQITPPIVAFVGFRESYIVLCTQLDSWAIFPPKVIADTPRTQVKQRRRKTTKVPDQIRLETGSSSNQKGNEKQPTERSKTIIPRIWRDVNGNLTKSVWNGCLNTLFETIFNRPGITLGQLSRIYYSAVTLMEIKDILDHMISQGILRKVCVSTPLKLSSKQSHLFTKKVPLKMSKMSDTINDHCQTSYWVSSGYYNYIS
ncbi:unnamed protein product [Cunninghamella blakesleeana]